jgi:hypothetical protein
MYRRFGSTDCGRRHQQQSALAIGRLVQLAIAAAAFLLALTWPGGTGSRAASSVQLAVIANPGVPVKSQDGSELAAIFSRTQRTWKDGTPIRPLNLSPGSAERIAFDRAVLHLEPDQSAQFWVDKMVRGEEAAPKSVSKVDIVVRLVPNLPGAIAYVPADAVDGKSRVLAFVRNGKVVAP